MPKIHLFIAIIFRKLEISFPKFTKFLQLTGKRLAPKFGNHVASRVRQLGLSSKYTARMSGIVSSDLRCNLINEYIQKNNFKTLEPLDFIIFGLLPPAVSSISKYNFEVYGRMSKATAIISPNIDFGYIPLYESALPCRIFTSWSQIDEKLINSDTKILVTLGNSPEHISVLTNFLAFKSKYELHTYSLQLHDGSLQWLFELTFGKPFVMAFQSCISNNPKENAATKNYILVKDIFNYLVGEPRILICHTTFAYRQFCIAFDRTQTKVVHVDIPHLENLDFIKKLQTSDTFTEKETATVTIGTFGAADHHKGLIEIIESLNEIYRKQQFDFVWVVAGFKVSEFLSNIRIKFPIEIIESPADQELLAIMNRCDLAIQWRSEVSGEASGVLRQLDILGIPAFFPRKTEWISHNENSLQLENLDSLANHILNSSNSSDLGRFLKVPDASTIRSLIREVFK